jgi:hypothetical protein
MPSDYPKPSPAATSSGFAFSYPRLTMMVFSFGAVLGALLLGQSIIIGG